jgi:hypothetical protein
MHAREKAFSKFILITCHNIYRLSKCPTPPAPKKKPIDKIATNNWKIEVKERKEKQTKKAANARTTMRISQQTTNKITKAKFVVV